MVERVEGGEVEQESNDLSAAEAGGFDFEAMDRLIEDDKPEEAAQIDTEKPLEGEVETAEERAKLQARSIVGFMDLGFGSFGGAKYKDSDYKDGERHVGPALAVLNINSPILVVMEAMIYLLGRARKSIIEIKGKKAKEDKEGEVRAA